MKNKRALVIGLGRFGTSLVDELFDTSVEIAVIDKSAAAVDALKDRVSAAFVADGSDPGVLESVGAREMDVAVVTYGEDFEATVLAVATLAQMKVPAIMARAATGDGVSLRPRPDGASGLVSTATTSCDDATSASRAGTATSGVPAKTSLICPPGSRGRR